MALDRQSIEKQDFPTGSHGYDPQAVDAHLSALADEIAEFKSASRRRAEHLASAASDQVRSIIEAAEASAAEIQRSAEAEAQEIRDEAHHEANATRERASEEVREHVGRVSDATSRMLARLDGMEIELSGLLDTLRGGTGRLDADLRELSSDLEHAADVAVPQARAEFEPDPPPEPEPAPSAPASDVGPGWGSSTSTGDWGSADRAADSEQHPSGGGWDVPEPAHSASVGGEGAESSSSDTAGAETSGAAASWDSGASSPGWGEPATDAETSTPHEAFGASEGFGPPSGHEAAPAGQDWQHTPEAPEAAPVESGSEAFPESPSAPPGPTSPTPYGEPSHGSYGDQGFGAATPSEHGGQSEEDDDSEGARLIALNMALNGTPREETARYLSENFQLPNRDGLLDEVYASVEG